MLVIYILSGYFDWFAAGRSTERAFLGGDFQTGVIMKSQNSFILVMLVLFAAALFAAPAVFAGTIRSGQYYTWGIDTDTVAIPAGTVITEAVMTIHNISSSSDNANDSLYIYLLDEPRVGFVSGTHDGSSNPFKAQGVQMVRVHHKQSQGGQDVAYTFSELAVEYSELWEHFGFPLVFGPVDRPMVIESSLILDLIDYTGGGTSFGFGFDPNGNTDYDFDEITLELTVESFTDEIQTQFITITTLADTHLDVDLQMDNLWMYQNLPGRTASNLTASVSIAYDPLANSSYTYNWEFDLPYDVNIAPAITSGGGAAEAFCTFAAPDCDQPRSLSDSGQTFTIRVTVTGADFGNSAQAEAQFGIALLGDVNNDTKVNVIDHIIMNTFWQTGVAGPFTFTDCNINCDNAVNFIDRIIANNIWQGTLGRNSVSNPCPYR